MAKKTTAKAPSETPLMKQYNSIKSKHPDAILLFRVGDFYETFGEDAIKASEILGIVLTKRKNGAASHIELAGFPHHSLDTYLPKLVRAGHRVAICDQLEDPKMTKKIVKRGITELITPGLSFNDKILEHKANNFLASIHITKKETGVAFLDISTGEFLTAQGDYDYIDKLLQSLNPTEVLVQRNELAQFKELFGENFHLFCMEDWAFTYDFGREMLLKQFKTNSLKGFGIQDLENGITAAGACLQYLIDTQHLDNQHISKISRIEEDHYVWLDRFTIRNLELFNSNNEGASTVLDVLDNTSSPMGSRLLKRWLALPLKNINAIVERHNIVSHFIQHSTERENIKLLLSSMGDMERLVSKVAVNRISPREMVQLKNALLSLPSIKETCKNATDEALNSLASRLNLCTDIVTKIDAEIRDDAPIAVNKGKVIREGVNQELDELRNLSSTSKEYLKKVQERECEATGISSLKIGFNNVFGYYFEVRNTYKDKVPENWIRKQTLVNAERYITEELKDYETKILGAQEKIEALEAQLYSNLVSSLVPYISTIQVNAHQVATLDVLISFASNAIRYDYVKPEIDDSLALNIVEGRHPVIEQHLPLGEEYVSNNVSLDNSAQQVIMITGPNMSGKSALLRQTALIVLFAQIGSFVPAKKAEIGIVDKVFTRVGASDNISMGESTFMVEMNETASILNNLSERSLVLLDEIGRGTSTYDGVSIAWAIAEFIHEAKEKPKTLFATHYHELNEMTSSHERIKNYNVAIKEVNNGIMFLRKLIPGGSNHSFGIHVAKMAGMPKQVIKKANEVLNVLERDKTESPNAKNLSTISDNENLQLSFFQLDDPTLIQVRDEIIHTDVNTLTPLEALLKLNEIKKILGG